MSPASYTIDYGNQLRFGDIRSNEHFYTVTPPRRCFLKIVEVRELGQPFNAISVDDLSVHYFESRTIVEPAVKLI